MQETNFEKWKFVQPYSDVVVVFKDLNAKTTIGTIEAHKFVLSQCKYFERMFSVENTKMFSSSTSSTSTMTTPQHYEIELCMDQFDAQTLHRFFVLLYQLLNMKFEMSRREARGSVQQFTFRTIVLTLGDDPLNWIMMMHCSDWFRHRPMHEYIDLCIDNNAWRVEDRVRLCEYYYHHIMALPTNLELYLRNVYILVRALGNPLFLHTSLVQQWTENFEPVEYTPIACIFYEQKCHMQCISDDVCNNRARVDNDSAATKHYMFAYCILIVADYRHVHSSRHTTQLGDEQMLQDVQRSADLQKYVCCTWDRRSQRYEDLPFVTTDEGCLLPPFNYWSADLAKEFLLSMPAAAEQLLQFAWPFFFFAKDDEEEEEESKKEESKKEESKKEESKKEESKKEEKEAVLPTTCRQFKSPIVYRMQFDDQLFFWTLHTAHGHYVYLHVPRSDQLREHQYAGSVFQIFRTCSRYYRLSSRLCCGGSKKNASLHIQLHVYDVCFEEESVQTKENEIDVQCFLGGGRDRLCTSTPEMFSVDVQNDLIAYRRYALSPTNGCTNGLSFGKSDHYMSFDLLQYAPLYLSVCVEEKVEQDGDLNTGTIGGSEKQETAEKKVYQECTARICQKDTKIGKERKIVVKERVVVLNVFLYETPASVSPMSDATNSLFNTSLDVGNASPAPLLARKKRARFMPSSSAFSNIDQQHWDHMIASVYIPL